MIGKYDFLVASVTGLLQASEPEEDTGPVAGSDVVKVEDTEMYRSVKWPWH